MSVTAILMMVIVLGITWGGFGTALWLAYQKEQRKKQKK